jgi:hypothetical protein
VETTELNGGDLDAVTASLIMEAPEQPEDDREETQEELQLSDEDDETSEAEDPDDLDDADELEEDEAEEAEDAGHEELFTVKVDGQEVKVPLEDLKRSYSGQAYIQKGMQEAASAKKEAEGVYLALLEERQKTSELLMQLQSGQLIAAPTPPNRELFDKDPIGYMEAKVQYDEDVQAWSNQQYAIQQAAQAQEAQMQAALQVHLRDQMKELADAVPDFADAEKASKLRDQLMSYGAKEGYTAEELGQVVDHRAIKVLRKAMLYDQIVAKRGEADKKVEGAKPFVKPGTKRPARTGKAKARQTAASRMKKSGSVDDVAKYLLS